MIKGGRLLTETRDGDRHQSIRGSRTVSGGPLEIQGAIAHSYMGVTLGKVQADHRSGSPGAYWKASCYHGRFHLGIQQASGVIGRRYPYPLMVFSALLPWQFFSVSLTESGNSLVNNSQLVTKVYFPSLDSFRSSVAVGLCDFLISMVVYVALMLYYRYIRTGAS